MNSVQCAEALENLGSRVRIPQKVRKAYVKGKKAEDSQLNLNLY